MEWICLLHQDYTLSDELFTNDDNIYLYVSSHKTAARTIACVVFALEEMNPTLSHPTTSDLCDDSFLTNLSAETFLCQKRFDQLTSAHVVPNEDVTSGRYYHSLRSACASFKVWSVGRFNTEEFSNMLRRVLSNALWNLHTENIIIPRQLCYEVTQAANAFRASELLWFWSLFLSQLSKYILEWFLS